MAPPVVVLGLDSMPPGLLFERFLGSMPHLRSLMERGTWGSLRTCHPPITIPAWAVMFSGVDPGTLGLYGIHHRKLGAYGGGYVPTPSHLRHPPLWSTLSREGARVAVVGMPPGYPAPPVNGLSTGDFLTPDGAADSVYPPNLRAELEKGLGEPLLFDVTFRREDRKSTLRDIWHLTQQRWALARLVWKREKWDFFAVHDIGPDRFHHAFWKYFNPEHPGYEKGNPFEAEATRYYAMLDAEVGKMLALLPPDARILVASDHGTKSMEGCFAINEWLRREGFLSLSGSPPAGTPLEKAGVRWDRTRLWGTGGYYSRIFFNLRGREVSGILDPAQRAEVSEELRQKLSTVRTPAGKSLGAEIFPPQKLYREVQGDYPDLTAYFGNLAWRAAGTLGHSELFLTENDTGPDDAVHDWEGIYLLSGTGKSGKGPEQSILDVAPTLLSLMGRAPTPGMQGKVIREWVA